MSYRSHSHHSDSTQPADHWAYEYPKGHYHDPHQAHASQPRPPRSRNRNRNRKRRVVAAVRRTTRWSMAAGRSASDRSAFWIVFGSLVMMAGWSVLTGTYFAFHDDVLKRLIARQAEMQYAYEDRIAELRAQVDRITSRQLLDQEQFEQKLDSSRAQAIHAGAARGDARLAA